MQLGRILMGPVSTFFICHFLYLCAICAWRTAFPIPGSVYPSSPPDIKNFINVTFFGKLFHFFFLLFYGCVHLTPDMSEFMFYLILLLCISSFISHIPALLKKIHAVKLHEVHPMELSKLFYCCSRNFIFVYLQPARCTRVFTLSFGRTTR